MSSKNKSSYRRSTIKNKDINSYGYNVADFSELDIPVKRDSETGRLVSIHKDSKTKKIFK